MTTEEMDREARLNGMVNLRAGDFCLLTQSSPEDGQRERTVIVTEATGRSITFHDNHGNIYTIERN